MDALEVRDIELPAAPKAEALHRQALSIVEAFYGGVHHETAYTLTHLGRALIFEKKFDEGVTALERALAIRQQVYGPVHPLVASTVNEPGNAALQRERLDEAEARFTQMITIYRQAYGEANFRMGIALSNLASVYNARKEYRRAEDLFRRVVKIHTAALSPGHMNTGIARIKLGRALLRQNRWREAADESLAGYEIVARQAASTVSFLHAARTDLAAAFDSLRQPAKSARFHAELEAEARQLKPAVRGK